MWITRTLLSLLLLLVALLPQDAWSAVISKVYLFDGRVSSPIADVTVTGTATLIVAANDNRVTVNCTNTSTSVAVRWGPATVTATLGQQIPAGGSIEIRNIGAVYMISEGTDVTVACTEELQ